MSIRKKNFRVIYTVKNESGYLVEKSLQFPTFSDAREFVTILQSGGNLVGKPIYELR